MLARKTHPQEARDGHALASAEIDRFVRGLVDGSWSEGQVAAWPWPCSCVAWAAMNARGAHARHAAFWARHGLGRHAAGPVLDKHSTGGVGDKVSLMLAPLVAACGGYVPMISAAAWAIPAAPGQVRIHPGYGSTTPEPARFDRVVPGGCAVIGQTADLAPADKRLTASAT